MQKFEGDVRTMPAPNFIPLEVINFFFNVFKTKIVLIIISNFEYFRGWQGVVVSTDTYLGLTIVISTKATTITGDIESKLKGQVKMSINSALHGQLEY